MNRRPGGGVRRPSARVGRNRRCAILYVPAGLLGALLVLASAPLNGSYLAGALLLLGAAGGFVLESGPIPPVRAGRLR